MNALDEKMQAGAQKAAAVLLAMGKPSATQLLRHFTSDELRDVTRAVASLGAVTQSQIEDLVDEFAVQFAAGASLLGDEGHARALIEDAVPAEQIASLFCERAQSAGPDVWRSLGAAPEAAIAAFVKQEHPLTATFVLSRLDPSVSAQIATLLPRDLRNEILLGLIAPPELSPTTLRVLEESLADAFAGGGSDSAGRQRMKIAEIINNLDPVEAEDVMRVFAAARPQDARALRGMLFSFQDLPRLSQRARALLFDKVSTEIVVLALRGSDAEFREPVLSAMASRSRRLVEGELANPSSSPPAEADKARKQIVKLVLEMAQRGEIELPTNDDAAAEAA